MANELVAYSRAGDVFHYRWAARRCLQLIYPNAALHTIVIEGAIPSAVAHDGEYVLDLSEYATIRGSEHVDYYQLKHTTVQEDAPFKLGDFRNTLTGFANKFAQHLRDSDIEPENITFTILTNRPIDDSVKNNMVAIAEGRTISSRTMKTMRGYATALDEPGLRQFCSCLRFEDGQGDYNVQRQQLRAALNQLTAGSVDNAQLSDLTTFMQDKVMPDSNGVIKKEDILLRFGVTSEQELYPAPALFNEIETFIPRSIYDELISEIQATAAATIIHAGGGVGKSVLCQQLFSLLPEGWAGVAYDCFGAGGYRNRSTSRHRHRDALVQVANELAARGLCAPIIVHSGSHDKDIMRTFITRLEESIACLRRVMPTAQLLIIFDAADNAEMAAIEMGDNCFAKELLRENLPQGCKMVFSSRTERLDLLQPHSSVQRLEISPFNQEESSQNLKKYFPGVAEIEVAEFHRLTSGNPRVQANALNEKFESIDALLKYLGPSALSVDDQIAHQLRYAVDTIKDSLPRDFHSQIDAICLGLASLPPYVPIEVLAKVSGIAAAQIRSFVADIGRPLWITETAVQFRDEPTETWFRHTFMADQVALETYIRLLEPIATQFTYVASVLPQLYLAAAQYSRLIEVALSDQYLPVENPIDTRNVRVFRLQFALKAALRLDRYADAASLAMRAGEEVAGDSRQFFLMRNNIDLLVKLQSKEKVQEIAFKRMLSGAWDGSVNVYAAALLSGIEENHGEASGFLRSAHTWLRIHVEESQKTEAHYHQEESISQNDVLELSYACLNIHGEQRAMQFLAGIRDAQFRFLVAQALAKRLIDLDRFAEIDALLRYCDNEPYVTVAFTAALMEVARHPAPAVLASCLDLLCDPTTRIKKSTDTIRDQVLPAIIAFLEACLAAGLPRVKMLWALRAYVPMQAPDLVASNHFSNDRTVFFKALAIRVVLSQLSTISAKELQPLQWIDDNERYDRQVYNEFTQFLDGLMPWFILRARLIAAPSTPILQLVTAVDSASKKAIAHRYHRYDSLPKEIAAIQADLISFMQGQDVEVVIFYEQYLQADTAFEVSIRLKALRAANRLAHLSSIVQELELSTYEMVKSDHGRGPDEISEDYLALARAVVNTAVDDAGVYFNEAVTIVSKFGEEMIPRWEAVSKLAEQSATTSNLDELAYRFIRCAELVGTFVSREKHWSRSKAFRVCAKLSAPIALAALSRWRDRAVTGFSYNLMALLTQLTSAGYLSAAVGWSLARLRPDVDNTAYLGICLGQNIAHSLKQQLYDDAVTVLSQQGAGDQTWQQMLEFGQLHALHIPAYVLRQIHEMDSAGQEGDIATLAQKNDQADTVGNYWKKRMEGIEAMDTSALRHWFFQQEELEQTVDSSYPRSYFYKHLIARITERQLWDVCKLLLASENVNNYEMGVFLAGIPAGWKSRVSFQAKWAQFMVDCGSRYGRDLSNRYSFDQFVKQVGLDVAGARHLKKGIVKGIATGGEIEDAMMLFGFVEVTASLLDQQQAAKVVASALERFELHMDPDFGDGPWAEWLYPGGTAAQNVAEFVWSALGSPKTSERWCAAHCVRKLADFDCTAELQALVANIENTHAGAYCGRDFIFYHLTARQFLLIAFSHISHTRPHLLRPYVTVLTDIALTHQHLLIQLAAANTALSIEEKLSGSIDRATLQVLNGIGKPLEVRQVEDYYRTDSIFHQQGSIDTSLKFRLDFDFEEDWLAPMGDVFGISGNQIAEIASNVIINEWGVGRQEAFKNDARNRLWASAAYQDQVLHRHGEYPRIERLSFYLSYHAMLVVAAKLIHSMPVVKQVDDDNPWQDWLAHHWLSRNDGRWLADGRVALPDGPNVDNVPGEGFPQQVEEATFFIHLKEGEHPDVWLNIRASWQEPFNADTQKVTINSALVSPQTSFALMRALSTYSTPYHYHIPDYEQGSIALSEAPFTLKGWILNRYTSKGIDEQDPYADHIDYPFYELAGEIISACGLVRGPKDQQWLDPETGQPVLEGMAWSRGRDEYGREPRQYGLRLGASMAFLQKLCQTMACHIIFEVQIQPHVQRHYEGKVADHQLPFVKIFILTQDGSLSTTTATYIR